MKWSNQQHNQPIKHQNGHKFCSSDSQNANNLMLYFLGKFTPNTRFQAKFMQEKEVCSNLNYSN